MAANRLVLVAGLLLYAAAQCIAFGAAGDMRGWVMVSGLAAITLTAIAVWQRPNTLAAALAAGAVGPMLAVFRHHETVWPLASCGLLLLVSSDLLALGQRFRRTSDTALIELHSRLVDIGLTAGAAAVPLAISIAAGFAHAPGGIALAMVAAVAIAGLGILLAPSRGR
jgi:hypothetical protein